MKMRILAIALVVFAIAITLTSCSTTTEADELNPFDDRFVECDASRVSTVIVDKLTGVCYIYRKVGYGAGMTVLLDADGTPLLYKEAWEQAFGGAE